MKKNLILIFAFFALTVPMAAQITREKANEIVLEHLKNESITSYALYLHHASPFTNGITLTTLQEEKVIVKYKTWLYFLHKDPMQNNSRFRYLLVNEHNGNLMEIITYNDRIPTNLATIWEAIPFVPVSGITQVPLTVRLDVDNMLSGMIVPNNASAQTIKWSISESASTATATIIDLGGIAVLRPTSIGMVAITATVQNGLAIGVPYSKDFNIIVSNNNCECR